MNIMNILLTSTGVALISNQTLQSNSGKIYHNEKKIFQLQDCIVAINFPFDLKREVYSELVFLLHYKNVTVDFFLASIQQILEKENATTIIAGFLLNLSLNTFIIFNVKSSSTTWHKIQEGHSLVVNHQNKICIESEFERNIAIQEAITSSETYLELSKRGHDKIILSRHPLLEIEGR